MIMKNFTPITLVLTISLSLAFVNPIKTLAQSSSTEANSDSSYQSNEQNPSSVLGNSFSPFDIIHNMNLNRGGFDMEASNQSINQAASDFKEMQQQRLLEMLGKTTSSNEVTDLQETLELQ
jgi:hypothetical protein